MENENRRREVEQLISATAIKSDIYLQYQLICHLKLLWNTLGQTEKQSYISNLAPLTQRLANAKDSHAANITLERIIQLEPEAIFNSLRYDATTESDYKILPGEEVYPSGGDDWFSRYLRWARAGSAPLGFHFWSAATLLGFTCSRKIWVPGATEVYMNMYTILGADRSAGKGQALSAAVYLLEKINTRLEARDGPDSEKLLTMIPSDATIESVVTFLRAPNGTEPDIERNDDGLLTITPPRRDAVGFLPLDEMATFLGKDAWNITQKIPFLTTAKESRRYRKMTKSGGIEELENLALTILANVAPDWMHNTIELDILGGGLGDRILWCYRDPVWERREQYNILNSQPLDPLTSEFLADFIINNIIDLDLKVPAILDPVASASMSNFHKDSLAKEKTSYLKYGTEARQNTANRVLWMVTQLSTLLAIAEGSFPPLRVRQRHVEQAVAIWKIEEASMEIFMDKASGKKQLYWSSQILEFIKSNGGCVTRGVVHQYFNPKVPSGAKTHIQTLLDQEQIEEIDMDRRRGFYRLTTHECGRCTS